MSNTIKLEIDILGAFADEAHQPDDLDEMAAHKARILEAMMSEVRSAAKSIEDRFSYGIDVTEIK